MCTESQTQTSVVWYQWTWRDGANTPECLLIDKDDGNVFVSDCLCNRIQVFTKEGKYLRTIQSKGIFRPVYLAILSQHLFVSCYFRLVSTSWIKYLEYTVFCKHRKDALRFVG